MPVWDCLRWVEVGRTVQTVGGTILWAGPGLNKTEQRETCTPACIQHPPVPGCGFSSCFKFLLSWLQWWAVICKCEPNKVFSLKIALKEWLRQYYHYRILKHKAGNWVSVRNAHISYKKSSSPTRRLSKCSKQNIFYLYKLNSHFSWAKVFCRNQVLSKAFSVKRRALATNKHCTLYNLLVVKQRPVLYKLKQILKV